MLKKMFLFALGGAVALAGKKYSREISRAVIRNAVRVDRSVRQIAAEARAEAEALELEPRPVRRIEAVTSGPRGGRVPG